jgi:hypothetical protein
LANTHQLEIMRGHAEASGTPHAAIERLKPLVPEPAALKILDLSAFLTDEMMMMAREVFRKLEALNPLGFVGQADQSQRRQKLHRSVDRHEIDTSYFEPGVNLADGQRRDMLDEHADDAPARFGEP